MSKSSRTILFIDKSGTIKEIQVKQEDIPNNLYKKAGLKTPDDFAEQFVWELNLNENVSFDIGVNTEESKTSSTKNYSISIYGKKVGKQVKNTYGFPPPLEETNLYGNCLLVNNRGSITLKEWNNLFELIYEKYDADDEDEANDSSSEINEDADADEEGDADEEVEEDDNEEQIEKQNEVKRKNSKKNAKTAISDFELTYIEEQYLDCEMELEPEEYLHP